MSARLAGGSDYLAASGQGRGIATSGQAADASDAVVRAQRLPTLLKACVAVERGNKAKEIAPRVYECSASVWRASSVGT